MEDPNKKALDSNQAQAIGGLANKEIEPIPVKEIVKPSEPEIALSQEEKEAGVQEVQKHPELLAGNQDLQHGDIEQVSVQPTVKVKLPMTEEEVVTEEKVEKDPSSSRAWWIRLVHKAWRRIRGKGKV